MTLQEFWKLVSLFASNSRGNVSRTAQSLDKHLRKLPAQGIEDFSRHFADLQNTANTPAVLEAAYIIGCGHSNDGFTDFRRWIVLQGQKEFGKIVNNPDYLGTYDRRADPVENWYCEYDPGCTYEEVTGDEPPHFNVHVYPEAESDYRDETILSNRYPKLWKRCRK